MRNVSLTQAVFCGNMHAVYVILRLCGPKIKLTYMTKHIFKIFWPLDDTEKHSSFSVSNIIAIFRRGARPPNGGFECRWVGKNRDYRLICGFIACCQRCDRQVLYTQLRRTAASWWYSSLVAISVVVCCLQETEDDDVFMTRSLNVTQKTTEHNVIVRSGKSEAEVIIEYGARGIMLLKLTTDRHGASRGLSATAEFHVGRWPKASIHVHYHT